VLIASFLYTTGQQELQARMYASNYAALDKAPWRDDYSYGSVDWEARAARKPGWLEKIKFNWRAKREMKEQAENKAMQEKVDAILLKVHEQGIASLSGEERRILNLASSKARENR